MTTISSILFRVTLLGATALLFTGCVGVVPRPVSSTKVEYGQQVKPADTAFIGPGVTTRAEVITRLGTNYVALPMQRAIAYSWEMKGGGVMWWWFLVTPYGGGGDVGCTAGGWRALFIAFDDQGVVTATTFKSPSMRHSMHEHLYGWADKLPANKPAPLLAGMSK